MTHQKELDSKELNLKQLTDDQFNESGIQAVRTESHAGINTMNHVIEANRRHIYSKYNCSSLHEYCVKHWKMTNGDAWRKISAAKLVNEQPGLEMKLEDGSLTQTHLAEAAVFFKKENFTPQQKTEALKEIENTTTEKAKSILLSKSKAPEKYLKDRVKQKTSKLTEVTLYLDEEAMEALSRLKEVWSNAIPSCELSKIAKRAIKEAVEKHDPKMKDEKREIKQRQQEQSKKQRQSTKPQHQLTQQKNPVPGRSQVAVQVQTPAPGSKVELKTAKITKAQIKHAVWKRDQYQCTYVDIRTNERCRSKHFIEEDHIIPKAKGGAYTVENLRLRCRTHNQRHAINTYGLMKMRQYVKDHVFK